MEIPVRIVLVETSHPGNIGAAARAMKTMGLADLALVRPKHFPSEEATARAAGAVDILENAAVVDTLGEAVRDCGFVVGTSARLRSLRWSVVDPRVAAASICRHLHDNHVAIVMGPEQSGLTNEDLARCQQLVHIPTNADFGSLNVAMAVQVLCYELRMTRQGLVQPVAERREAPLASAEELEGFHAQLERLLIEVGFLRPNQQRRLKLKLRRLFMRAELDQNEINILRGALSALDDARQTDPQGTA